LPSNTKIDLICDAEKFKKLRNDWNFLVKNSIHPQPFLLWEWMFTWWEVYARSSYELMIQAVYVDNKLVALAPFYVDNSHFLLKGRLRMIGEGEPFKDEVVSHFPDIITLSEFRKPVVSVVVDFLLLKEFSWRFGQFRFMINNSVLNDIQQKLSKHFDHHTVSSGQAYAIDLPNTSEAYVESLSRSMRKQFRSRLSRMEKSGEIRIVSAQEFDDPHEALEILERLHRARWEKKGDACIFDSQAFKAFHKKLLDRFIDQGIIDIRVMYHNDEAVAAVHNFNYNNRCYSYQSGFKSRDDRRFSPMLVFDVLEIQTLVSAGFIQYHYLSAEGNVSYKEKFKCVTEPVFDRLWVRRGWQSFIIKDYLRLRTICVPQYKRFKALGMDSRLLRLKLSQLTKPASRIVN